MSAHQMDTVRVGWVGPRPGWLSESAADAGVVFTDAADAEVVHVAAGGSVPALPARAPVVVEVGEEWPQSVELQRASAIVAPSRAASARLAAHDPALGERTVVVRRPLDLAAFAPERSLLASEGPRLKRFKRFHRLGVPAVLYVGPYTRAGGLDTVIEAGYVLRETHPEVRIVAVPAGPVDASFLDECEMRALGLGHRGIVEWTVDEAELPFWFATATVVTTPVRELSAVPDAVWQAAAAGRPFIGSDLEPLRAETADLDWATLVAVGDATALAAACAARFAIDEPGVSAREWAERELSADAIIRHLAELWRRVVPNADSLQVA
jgi:glycosyltransferase involved in cell wall biosynthesis